MKKSYSVSEFKAKSLGIIEQIAKTGERITITKRGKPIAEVVPFQKPHAKAKLGRLAETAVFVGDLITPFRERLWKAADSGSGESD